MNTRLYLDTRSSKENAPLKYAIAKNGKTAYIPLEIKLNEDDWDKSSCKVLATNRQYKTLNQYIANKKVEYDNLVMVLATRQMSAIQIRDAVLKELEPSSGESFLYYAKEFGESRKAEHTRYLYEQTYNKVRAYACEQRQNPDELSFEDIDKKWLEDFDRWLENTGSKSKNSRAIHLRNIRSIFNYAIDNDVISCYPFRKYKIKTSQTKHRALSVEDLRKLFSLPLRDNQVMPLDMFKLSFFLIGINAKDLIDVPKDVIVAGRYEYSRRKTDKQYSIKIEPEAKELLKKYKGTDGRLLNVNKENRDIDDFVSLLDAKLQRIGEWEMHPKSHHEYCVKPFNNKLSWYWARHTWASIAAELEIPKETITQALGHSTRTVTDVYIAFNRKKVDDANRKVIDYVLYDKRD